MASIKIKNPAYTEGGIEPKWLTIPMYAKMNPFEVLNITLMSNVPAPDRSMYGADITVVTADGVKILDTDWFGQPITLNIDEGVTYTVTVSVSDCYTAQEELSFTFTAASNNIRNLNIHYKANGIKVNMLTTAGASINKPAIITYMSGDNEESVEVFHGEIAALPLGVEATIIFPQVNGFKTPEPYTFTVTKDTVEYTATYSIAGITKIRINNNISDPDGIIETLEDTGGVQNIRNNSHLYTGEVVDGIMQLKQLDDTTGNTYLDGTVATINVPGIDVWMKLPLFYYKVEEYYTDIYDISFSMEKPDDTWKEWDGKDLIGAYIFSANNNKLYSCQVSGTYRYGISKTDALTYAANRGEGFRITLYKHHCVMLWLCFSYYGATNKHTLTYVSESSFAVNRGGNSYDFLDNTMSMVDSSTNTSRSSERVKAYVHIWGLQCLESLQPEYIGNVTIQNNNMIINNDDGSETIIPFSSPGWLSKLKPTENLLSIPYEYEGTSSTYFCSYTGRYGNKDTALLRGSSVARNDSYHISPVLSINALLTSTGSAGLSFKDEYDNSATWVNTARLTYRGDWVIID